VSNSAVGHSLPGNAAAINSVKATPFSYVDDTVFQADEAACKKWFMITRRNWNFTVEKGIPSTDSFY